MTYQKHDKEKFGEANYSLSLVNPDSSRFSKTAWINEVPNPGERSMAFRNYLQYEEDKAYWTKVLFIGGGGFFFMLAVGLWYFRSFKNKRQSRD
ncbi:MAG: hypothetical protein IPO32_00330 [Crocinitomicaceae bacterium]|nr:hypothetical protein [Crocinitomicaceae bacterium]